MPTESLRNMNVRFFNDALLGYNEVELNGSGSVSFIAAMAQTSSALPSGSIPEPFNTSWGVSEKEFLKSNYYPSSQGNAWMWNDGYKVKHVKVNNRSYLILLRNLKIQISFYSTQKIQMMLFCIPEVGTTQKNLF